MSERHISSIKGFLGVDFSNPSLSVADTRAINIANFVMKDGVNQKRKGWEQILQADEYTYYTASYSEDGTAKYIKHISPPDFNAVWTFTAEDGESHTFAHIGNVIFEIKGLSDEKSYKTAYLLPLSETVSYGGSTYNVCISMPDCKSQEFECGGKCYILTGDGYYLLRCYKDESGSKRTDLSAVDDSTAFVPTTAIGITYKDSDASSRKLLDDTNMLTPLRKNKLVSDTIVDPDNTVRTTRFYEYQLDSDISFSPEESTEDIEVQLTYRSKE